MLTPSITMPLEFSLLPTFPSFFNVDTVHHDALGIFTFANFSNFLMLSASITVLLEFSLLLNFSIFLNFDTIHHEALGIFTFANFSKLCQC